jgi:hypothetical protein
MFSGRSIVVLAKEQTSGNMAEEAVILNLEAGVYYGLNSVAARVWNLIQESKTVSVIRDTLPDEYDVDSDRCERDLLELLRDLAAKGLINALDEAASQDRN